MQDMIQFRGISVEHVRMAIREPDWTKPVFEGKIKVCKQLQDGRAIRVIYYKDGFRDTRDFMVVTAYYTDKC